MTLSLSIFNDKVQREDCLDFAIDALERPEDFRGSLMNDLEGTELMNQAYAQCKGQS
ncbi:hypothetical protein J2Q11_00320 [Tenacibaculum finnmarkense genomovar finnmarkense]|uniref:hypothetical protein n=1 Tax=Tenacibaculum finnmarkense TaxID=2781243 RepID=UPI001E39CE07|nr:hypothetical protein [Tenacibaculum finnmarkense]MCD8416767.1 hypothetical protein [Tenacibaculum finnmarkense genomovar finnmarkense]MCG8184749.1 hypothetical protein [Tenacibaculum finnmarkense genomovar finnmarkense]MCG8201635.1 hypothetical protein [Tenacibaculum finnmarkense genomovar finnmarkense]MCG8206347.1 hypothetical protein [Tenacibaculum finnmarkense genomovar finnmarkense]MCG8208545.1 hypothetical protein [Tenacibaculum finnmarkense genomovar finnmarkense]